MMKEKIPVRLLLFPPIVAAAVIGIGVGLVALGIALASKSSSAFQISMIWTGTGVILGFLWGSIIWADKLAQMYSPRQYAAEVNAIKPEPVRLEIVDRTDGRYKVDWIDLPADITLQQMVKLGKLLQENDFKFGTRDVSGKYKPLSRAQYEILRDLLVKRKFAYWESGDDRRTQGVALRAIGKSLFVLLTTYSPDKRPRLLDALKVMRMDAHTHTENK